MAKFTFHDCRCQDCGHTWTQGVPPKRCPTCHGERTVYTTQEDNLPPKNHA